MDEHDHKYRDNLLGAAAYMDSIANTASLVRMALEGIMLAMATDRDGVCPGDQVMAARLMATLLLVQDAVDNLTGDNAYREMIPRSMRPMVDWVNN